ncbi:hypothetical protein HMF3257_30820 [Spirosoma telluris]|uniref:Uncharacterized protein n=2 Tax=Spirosoma telluris TaxID=2183553 RepID=A0A327NQH7_9BACT|nr:hypothetical protein HMF3257_30820 [Spirosoma telluris]
MPSWTLLQVNGAGGISTSGTGAEFRFRDQTSTRSDFWSDEWVWYAKDNIGRFGKVGFANDIFKFDQYGRVGVFTSGLPEARLDVAGDAKANYLTIRPQGGLDGGEISLAGSVGSPSWQMDVYDNTFRLHTNGGIPLQVFANGNLWTAGSVGIGTTSPLPSYTRFQVNGAGGISTTGTGAEFRFANRNSTPGYSYAWQEDWIWYAQDNMARFSKGGVGDLMTISATGLLVLVQLVLYLHTLVFKSMARVE